MKIGLSCSDYTWPRLGHETVMSVISDLGFQAVDIGIFNTQTHVTVPAVLDDPQLAAERTIGAAREAGLAVADVFLTSDTTLERLSPTSLYKGDWEHLQRIFSAVIEFTKIVGSSGITLLPGVVEQGTSYETALQISAERLSVLANMAAKENLATSVEPHVGSIIEDPQSTLKLLELCPELTITLDPSHFGFLNCSVDAILPLIGRTRHVQVRPAGSGVMQTRLIDNQLDLDLLVAALCKSNYVGWIASEFVWMEKWGCDRVDNTTESFFLRGYLQQLLAKHERQGSN